MRVSFTFPFYFFISVILICCENEPTGRDVTIFESITDNEVFVYWGTEPEPIKIKVANASGPLHNVPVVFQAMDQNIVIDNSRGVTDANGIAFAYVSIAEGFSGETVIEASTPGINETIRFTFKVSASKATTITILSGNNQEYIRGYQAPEPLTVQVTDDFGNAASDVPVTFSIDEGFGTVLQGTVITNSAGNALAHYRLSDSTSVNIVSVAIATDTVQFSLVSLFPSEFVSLSKSFTDITITWQKSSLPDFTQYMLRRTEATGSGEVIIVANINDINTTSFVDTNVRLKEIYIYELIVKTQRGLDLSAESQSIEFGIYTMLDAECEDIEVDEERNQIYVSVPGKNSIYVIDLSTTEITDKIVVGSLPTGLCLSNDGSTLYVALSGSGEVAFLNPDTKDITKVDVGPALGNNKVHDLLEGAPHQVFVTANPGSFGSARLAVIKTNEGNKVERFYNADIRLNPVMYADYDNTLYVLSGVSLFKIDLHQSYPSENYYNPDHYLFDQREFMVMSPDYATMYFSGFSIHTDNFESKHTFPIGTPVISLDGTYVYYFSVGKIFTYSTSNAELLSEIPFQENVIRKVKITSGSKLVVLSSIYASGDRVFILPL